MESAGLSSPGSAWSSGSPAARPTALRSPAAAVLESRSRLPELASIARERELASAPRGVGGSALRKRPAYSLEKHYAVDKADPALVHRPHREAHPASYTLRSSSPAATRAKSKYSFKGSLRAYARPCRASVSSSRFEHRAFDSTAYGSDPSEPVPDGPCRTSSPLRRSLRARAPAGSSFRPPTASPPRSTRRIPLLTCARTTKKGAAFVAPKP